MFETLEIPSRDVYIQVMKAKMAPDFCRMNAEQILQLIPEAFLEQLSAETKVNHQVKKLTGLTTFKLILFSMLNTQKLSLRVMEEFYKSANFKAFSGAEGTTKYNSIRDRIVTIDAAFFEKIFLMLFDHFNKELKEQQAIVKVDTTFIAISAKLVDWSLRNSGKNKNLRHLKLGISLKGSLPCHVKMFTDMTYANDEIALPQTILSTVAAKDSVITFDRGVQSRKAFQEFNNENLMYVARLSAKANIKVLKSNPLPAKTVSGTVTINEDVICQLKDRSNKWTTDIFRVIKGTIVESGQPILFITNCDALSPYEIAAIYKQRWEIEVFIKFLKQNLNLTHIVSRDENGIKVIIYMTLILAMLIIVYKKKNKIGSYKIAKLRLEIELDNLLLKEIVTLCGGDPQIAPHLWNTS